MSWRNLVDYIYIYIYIYIYNFFFFNKNIRQFGLGYTIQSITRFFFLTNIFITRFIIFNDNFLSFFLAVLGVRCCMRAFSSCGKQGLLFVTVNGLLTVVAFLVAEHRL